VTTDLLGTANVVRTALRRFRAQERGTLIVTSSLLAHVAVPYISAYVTAKWGLRGLIRTVRQEFRDAPDIHICTLAPGSVDTPIYTSAANYAGSVGRPPPPVDPPEKMAAAIVGLADRPRAEVSVGATNRLIELGFVTLPGVYDALVGPLMRRFGVSGEPISPHTGNVFASTHRSEGGPARWGRTAVGAAVGGTAAVVGAAAALVVRRLR
jgi:short-subunit dehydrogenase